MKTSSAYLAALAAPVAQAILAPSVSDMDLVFQDTFAGCAGCTVDGENWNVITNTNFNNELQVYTESADNLQLSGSETLQIVPLKGPNGEWTSGRVESKSSWVAQPGGKLQIQAMIRLGESTQKTGVWPAFWTLGDSNRNGTPWPDCGEMDIFETINGDMTSHAVMHCDTISGGVCNQPAGLVTTTDLPSNDFHTWSLTIDRTSDDWLTESLTWAVDGVAHRTFTGAELDDEGVWASLAHSPIYMILNVAVGGDFPGPPDEFTEDGFESMMEVAYVAVYESS